jgi:G3E family GTPase
MKQTIPVTLVVGFLGSGKTTFINNILHGDHGKKIAVIENEFGEVGIDDELLKGGDDLFVEMNNGCICCTMRGDLVESLEKLLEKTNEFEHIVIEATGMANPGPIIETFFSSDSLAEKFNLDSVIGLVDCAHYSLNTNKFEEDEEIAFFDQIIFSETILLNKTDLVKEDEVKKIESSVRERNPNAKIFLTENSKIDLEKVMGQNSFDLSKVEDSLPEESKIEYPFSWGGLVKLDAGFYKLKFSHTHHPEKMVFFKVDEDSINDQMVSYASSLFFSPLRRVESGENLNPDEQISLEFKGHSGGQFILDVEFEGTYAMFLTDSPSHLKMEIINRNEESKCFTTEKFFSKMSHFHGDEVSSVALEFEGEINPNSFQMFLNVLFSQYKDEIYRSKGILNFAGNPQRVIFQGVYSSLRFDHGKEWAEDRPYNKIVFIGKGLIGPSLEAGIKNCLL